MTSRERVRAVINHEIPDHIPNGLGGCECTGLHVLTYDKLQNILGINKRPPRMNTFMSNAVFELDAIKAMEGDILPLASPHLCRSELWSGGWETQWKEQALWGKPMRIPVKDKLITGADGTIHWDSVAGNLECPPGSYFFDYPVKAGTMDDMDDYDYPSPDDINPSHDINDEKLRRLEDAAKRMFNETELSLCMGETLPDLQYLPGGMIRGMMFLAEYPEQMKEILKKFVDAALSQLRLLEQAVGKYVDILLIAHDLGDNRGVTIGPDMFREIYKPFYKELFGGWKKISSMKINLHACGAISDILDDLIECGLDIYNPVQISGNNMDPARLKSRFGSRLIFWGGAYDTHLNQPGDSYDEVYQRTYKNIKAFGKNGGYIMSGVHNLPPEIPEHHLKAILDAWKDARQYS